MLHNVWFTYVTHPVPLSLGCPAMSVAAFPLQGTYSTSTLLADFCFQLVANFWYHVSRAARWAEAILKADLNHYRPLNVQKESWSTVQVQAAWLSKSSDCCVGHTTRLVVLWVEVVIRVQSKWMTQHHPSPVETPSRPALENTFRNSKWTPNNNNK